MGNRGRVLLDVRSGAQFLRLTRNPRRVPRLDRCRGRAVAIHDSLASPERWDRRPIDIHGSRRQRLGVGIVASAKTMAPHHGAIEGRPGEPIRDGRRQDVLTLTYSAAVPLQQTPFRIPGCPPRPTRAMQ